jgi:hypothetical protein
MIISLIKLRCLSCSVEVRTIQKCVKSSSGREGGASDVGDNEWRAYLRSVVDSSEGRRHRLAVALFIFNGERCGGVEQLGGQARDGNS